MAGTGMKVLILILSIVIGGGVTYFASSLSPWMDDQMKIIIAIVLIFFTYISFYFMTKGSGG
jgi:membrane protein insertase Oxa1/YidC/SpoIIIJ